jgi:hypothetical protein
MHCFTLVPKHLLNLVSLVLTKNNEYQKEEIFMKKIFVAHYYNTSKIKHSN